MQPVPSTGKNQLVTYTQTYEDIFDNTSKEEQCSIAEILMENLKRKKEIENIKLY